LNKLKDQKLKEAPRDKNNGGNFELNMNKWLAIYAKRKNCHYYVKNRHNTATLQCMTAIL